MRALDQAVLLNGIAGAVNAWARAFNGSAQIELDPWNALKVLGDTPQTFRVVLSEAGDSNVNQLVSHQATVIRTIISAKVWAHPGFDFNKAQTLVTQAAGSARPALLTLNGALRAFILSLRFDAELVHRGMLFYQDKRQIVAPDGMLTQGWDLRFFCHHAAMVTEATADVSLIS